MTVEDCRMILKVHVKAAEQSGKNASAFALMEVLTAIDAQVAEENHTKRIL